MLPPRWAEVAARCCCVACKMLLRFCFLDTGHCHRCARLGPGDFLFSRCSWGSAPHAVRAPLPGFAECSRPLVTRLCRHPRSFRAGWLCRLFFPLATRLRPTADASRLVGTDRKPRQLPVILAKNPSGGLNIRPVRGTVPRWTRFGSKPAHVAGRGTGPFQFD
jgi:hypothetical protein